MSKVLFVCLANICRSPAAEGVLKHMIHKRGLKDIVVKSCGIGDWSIGQFPDERMRDSAKIRGVVLTNRAQQFHSRFLEEYDYILATDHEVLNHLYQKAVNPEHKAKLNLITAFSRSYPNQEIPDPYYQGEAAFDLVLDMLEDSCEGLLEHIAKSK